MKTGKILLTGGLVLAMTAGARAVPTWEEVGGASGTLPGIFRLGLYDSAANEETRVSIRPEVGLSREGRILLAFYSDIPESRTSSRNGLFALVNSGGNWAFQADSVRGAIYAAEASYMRHPNAMAGSYSVNTLIPSELTPAGAPSLFCAFPFIVAPEELYADAYGSLYTSAGWGARDGSLSPGGLTGPAAFSTQVLDSSSALDTFGNPYVVYSRGADPARASVFLKTNRLGAWSGLGGSDTTPLAQASGSTSTTRIGHHQAAVSFTGADPVVVWTERSFTIDRIKLRRWQSSTEQWVAIGTSATEGIGFGRNPQIANFQNRQNFFVAFEQLGTGSLFVLESDGTTFTDRGNPLAPWGLEKMAPFDDRRTTDPEPSVANFALALDRLGQPAVAFRAESPAGSKQFHVFVSWLNPANEWVAVGDPANVEGIDGLTYELPTPVPANRGFGNYNPSLVFTLDNRPIVAWEFDDANRPSPAILLRRASEPVSRLPVTLEQITARLLGTLDGTVALDAVLDDNADGVIDAGDVERIGSRTGQ